LCAAAAALPGAARPPPPALDFGDLAERLHAGGAAADAAAAGGEAPALERARALLLPSVTARRTRARTAAAALAVALTCHPLLRAPRRPAGLAAGLPGRSPIASPPPPRGALAAGGPDPAAADWGPAGAGSGAGLPRASLARIARGRDFLMGP
jgi:hypothetical protein